MVGRTFRFIRGLSRHPSVRWSLMALFIYTLSALVVLYPVPFRLNSVLAGFPARDGWQYAWWLWFAKRLLLEGRGLHDLYLLNHPVGLQHPFQWSLTYLSLVALPLEMLFSPAAAFNLMVLISFVLSGLAAYYLCRALTQNHWAAIVGGAIFAFAPNRLGHAMAGWLPQMTVYLFPLFALCLLRTVRQPTTRNGVILGLVAAPAMLVHVMHIAYFIVPLTLVIVGYGLLRWRWGFFSAARLRALGVGLLITAGISLPFLVPLLVGYTQGNLNYLYSGDVIGHSADLLAFFTPSPYHPLLPRLGLVPGFAHRVFPDQEWLRSALAYPGLVAVGLALWSVRRGWPVVPWVALALGAAILSLGPLLVVGRETVTYTVDGQVGHIVMPYSLVRLIPYYDLGRTPGRLNATGMLAVGVLAAYGMADLLARLAAFRWWAGLLALAAVALILFECLPIWPFPAGDATIPPVIQYITDQPGDGALLHLPMSRRRVNHRALYFQTATGRPIVGGEVHRPHPDTPPWYETIVALAEPAPASDIIPRPDLNQRRAWLRHFDVDWVLFHRLETTDEARYRPFIEELLGPASVEDETLAAFAVPVEAPAPESQRLYTFSRQGWYPPERDGGLWRRWMYDDGRLYLYSTREGVGCLRFTVDSHLEFPVLEVYMGEQLLDSFVVGERTVYTTRPFTLTQGMNVFRFYAPGECPQVLDDPRCWSEALLAPPLGSGRLPCDLETTPTTCRTFVFDRISVVPWSDLPPGAALDVNFGDQIRLRGWSLDATLSRPGGVLTMTLAWEAVVELSEQHVVFVHLLSPEGTLVAQHDAPLVGRLLPLSAWPQGTTFRYPVTIELPGDLPAGDYCLMVGVYLWPSLERLPVLADVPGAEASVVELENVRIAP
ncbi:MAG: hypothetical protein ISS49_11415 [Anaerolineae bacterium]|nr:hypothetical protein [Anaerolineae bacterium]